MSNSPFTQRDLPRSVLLNTAAQWALNGDVLLADFQTARETDTGKEKTGPGLFSALPYDAPSGQIYNLTSGTPDSDDQIAYNAVTAAGTAVATTTTLGAGTVGSVIIVGLKLYVIVASGATGDQINAGTTAATYATNIANKVTTDTASTSCTCVAATADLTFTANSSGAAGNSIPLSTTDTQIDALAVFHGGSDQVNVLKRASAQGVVGTSGTYTPTLTGITNVTSSTPALNGYSRVGNFVTVAGVLDVTPTASGLTRLDVTLPIASAADQVWGTSVSNIGTTAGSITANTSKARLTFTALNTSPLSMAFTFSYIVA